MIQNAASEEVMFKGLTEAVHYWGTWIKEQAEADLAEFTRLIVRAPQFMGLD